MARAVSARLVQAAAVAAIVTAASAPAGAEQAPPGAASCSGCHPPGLDESARIPPLNGRPAEAIANAMRAFRAGALSPTVMDRIAKGFSDAETDAIAGWLSRQPARSGDRR